MKHSRLFCFVLFAAAVACAAPVSVHVSYDRSPTLAMNAADAAELGLGSRVYHRRLVKKTYVSRLYDLHCNGPYTGGGWNGGTYYGGPWIDLTCFGASY
jgi:hypothetical protein